MTQHTHSVQVAELARRTHQCACNLRNEHGPGAAHGDVPSLEVLQQDHSTPSDKPPATGIAC